MSYSRLARDKFLFVQHHDIHDTHSDVLSDPMVKGCYQSGIPKTPRSWHFDKQRLTGAFIGADDDTTRHQMKPGNQSLKPVPIRLLAFQLSAASVPGPAKSNLALSQCKIALGTSFALLGTGQSSLCHESGGRSVLQRVYYLLILTSRFANSLYPSYRRERVEVLHREHARTSTYAAISS